MNKFHNTGMFGMIIILTGLLFLTTYSYVRSKRQNLVLVKENDINNSIMHSLINANKLEIKYIEQQMNEVPLIISEYDDTMKLSEYYPSKYKLGFLYSELNCQTCVDSALKIIFEERLDTLDNFIFISTYKRKQDLYEFKKMNNIKSPVYKVNNSELFDNLINENVPMFLLIKEDNSIAKLLVPIKEVPELTKFWLSECIIISQCRLVKESSERLYFIGI